MGRQAARENIEAIAHSVGVKIVMPCFNLRMGFNNLLESPLTLCPSQCFTCGNYRAEQVTHLCRDRRFGESNFSRYHSLYGQHSFEIRPARTIAWH